MTATTNRADQLPATPHIYEPDNNSQQRSRISVLYIDQTPSLLDIACRYLERGGEIIVDTAISAEDAILKLRYISYDIIVTDYNNRDIGGNALLKYVRTQDCHIPFVYFVLFRVPDLETEAEGFGHVSFIDKISNDHHSSSGTFQMPYMQRTRYRITGPCLSVAGGIICHRGGETPVISVLYVDDEPALLEITRLMLENTRDFRLTTVESATEGLNLLGENSFDAIISDYQMPGMDGIGFLKAVRSRMGDIPFLLFTGKGREEIAIEAINSGADFYVQKGGDPTAQFAELMHKVKIAVDRKRSRMALEQSEAKYRSVIENIQDVFYRCDCQGNLIMASPSWASLLGFSSVDECLGKNVPGTFWMYPEQYEAFLEAIHTRGKVENYEITLRHRDGRPIIVSTGSHLYFQDGCSKAGIEGIFRDITARKQAEERLDESRRLLESIIQGLPLPTFVINRNCQVIAWNQAMEEYSRIPAVEVMGTPGAHKAFYSTHRPCLADLIVRNDHGEISRWYKTTPVQSPLINGAYEATEFFPHMKGGVWLTFTAAPLRDPSGAIVGAVEILQDITAKRKNDEELVAAYSQMEAAFDEVKISQNLLTEQNWFLNQYETKYRQIVEASPDMIWEIDPDGHFTYISPQCEQYLGYSADELTGSSLFDLVPPERRDAVTLSFQSHCKECEPLFTLEIPSRNAEGEEIIFEIRALPVRDEHGALSGFRGVARDITDRKRVEDQFRQEKENFQTIFSAAPIGLLLLRQTREVIRANGPVLEMVLRDPADVIGRIVGSAIGCVHSMEEPRGCGFSRACPDCPLRLGIESVISKGESLRGERIRLDLVIEGRRREVWMSVNIEPLEIEKKRCVIVAMDDITRSVETEKALRESESRFREIFNNIDEAIELVVFDKDGLPGKYIEVNDVACRMLGYTREEMLRQTPRNIVLNKHNRPIASIVADLTTTGHTRFETEHCTKSGRIIPVEVSAHIVTIGGERRVMSVVRDISQRRLMDEAFQRLQRKVANLAAITREEMLNNVALAGSINTVLSHSADEEKIGNLLNRQSAAIAAIRRQIEFSGEFEKIGLIPPRWQPVPEMIDQAVSRLDTGKIRIINETAPMDLHADLMIERVFYHLAENALVHGRTLSQIRFCSREQWDNLIITCEDDGVGIPDAEKERILERGFGRHTGLGLYLSREILSMTGCKIRETGQFGNGARFEITIPGGLYRPSSQRSSVAAPPNSSSA